MEYIKNFIEAIHGYTPGEPVIFRLLIAVIAVLFYYTYVYDKDKIKLKKEQDELISQLTATQDVLAREIKEIKKKLSFNDKKTV